MSELVKQFADAYREGAHGATMDADSAMAVALAIDVVIKECEELHRWKHDQEVNWPMEIERRNKELAAMTQERDSLQQVFDLQWAADQRAIKRWQLAHPGNDNVWPDRADMVVFLMEQLDAVNRAVSHVSDEGHATGRTKAGNDISGL